MQNEQWNFDISEMTISSESSCSLTTTTAAPTPPVLVNRITQDVADACGFVGGSSDGDFLAPSILNCDSVEYEKALREVDEVVKDANNCDQIGDEASSENKDGQEDEKLDEEEDESATNNELVRLPGGNY